MDGQNYTRKYLYNNELTSVDAIPPDTDFLCVLVDDNDQQLLIEHYEGGELAGLIGQVQPGESRQHASIFHFSGQLVAHQCTIFSSDGSPVKNFWLKSPLDDGANRDDDNPYAYGNPMMF